jgi:hypothetical protein
MYLYTSFSNLGSFDVFVLVSLIVIIVLLLAGYLRRL